MLLEELKRSIIDMKEIQQLEQISNDSQKQKNIDELYKAIIIENSKVVNAIDTASQYVQFAPSNELICALTNSLEESKECMKLGLVQEYRIKTLQNDTKILKEKLISEWSFFYMELTEKKVATLKTVKEITPDKIKTGYAINKISDGNTLSLESTDKLKRLAEGISDAEKILDDLGLDEEIMQFLDKVSSGTATILDLSSHIVEWINNEKLDTEFAVRFS